MFDLFGCFGQGRTRTLVKAHDKHWVVCVDLGEVRKDGGDRLALAVLADSDGRVPLPSPPAQVIEYTPADVQEKRQKEATCQEKTGHAIGEWQPGIPIYDMVRRCDCGKVREEREATPEEVAANRERFEARSRELRAGGNKP